MQMKARQRSAAVIVAARGRRESGGLSSGSCRVKGESEITLHIAPTSPYEPASPQDPPTRGTHSATLAVCLVGRYFRILNYTSASERADHGDDWCSPRAPGLQG